MQPAVDDIDFRKARIPNVKSTMCWRSLVFPGPQFHYDNHPQYKGHETAAMLQAMHQQGFVLIQGVLRNEEVQEARLKIDQLTPIHWDFMGGTDHYKNVFNRDPYWLNLLDRDGIIDLAEIALGATCHIIGETAWRSHPGTRGVGLHLDYLPMEWPEPGVPPGISVPMFLCTAHFYLSPQPIELCPTWVIPGSHRAGRRPQAGELHWNNQQLQPVLCQAGDVLFFRSDLWHSGSVNRTVDQTRYLLQVHYGRREMAQHFAPFMDWRFNAEVIAACSTRQRRLLGDHPRGAYD